MNDCGRSQLRHQAAMNDCGRSQLRHQAAMNDCGRSQLSGRYRRELRLGTPSRDERPSAHGTTWRPAHLTLDESSP